jgi:type I restriction enzyme S subunit
MMVTWPLVPLGAVYTYRKEFITIDDLKTYRRPRVQLHAKGIVLRDEVLGAGIKTKKQQVIRAGELLVAEIDAKVGGFGIVATFLEGAIVSSHYFRFKNKSERLDQRFLGWFIKTPAFREQIEAQGSTNYAAIRPAHVLSYQVPVPPLDEQCRIVARIEHIASKVIEAQGIRAEALREVQALQASWSRNLFSSLDVKATCLEETCSDIIDNLYSNPVYANNGIPCIRSPDVGFGTLDLVNARRTDEAEYRRRTVRGEPRRDDIVLVREGGGTGKCAIVLPEQRLSLGQRVMMLRPDATKIAPRFLLHQLLSPVIRQDHIQRLSKGSASPHLNIGALRKFPLKVPPLDQQHHIVSELDSLQAQVDAVKSLQNQTAAELDAMLPAILDKAFRGEL